MNKFIFSALGVFYLYFTFRFINVFVSLLLSNRIVCVTIIGYYQRNSLIMSLQFRYLTFMTFIDKTIYNFNIFSCLFIFCDILFIYNVPTAYNSIFRY